jgi:hypothetical protein
MVRSNIHKSGEMIRRSSPKGEYTAAAIQRVIMQRLMESVDFQEVVVRSLGHGSSRAIYPCHQHAPGMAVFQGGQSCPLCKTRNQSKLIQMMNCIPCNDLSL